MNVLAIGGGGFTYDERYAAVPGPLVRHALALTGKDEPRVTALYTATGDDRARVAQWYACWAGQRTSGGVPVVASHVELLPMPNVADLRAHLLAQDAVYVGGGSVAGLMALWRLHGLDAVMHEAAQSGVVLFGVSAGSLCWHTGGTTDSFGPELRPWTDGLGIVPGSHCPHYDSEARRRPLYQRLVREGVLDPGYAADDGVGLHYVAGSGGVVLHEAVRDREGAGAYRVTADGETAVPARLLT